MTRRIEITPVDAAWPRRLGDLADAPTTLYVMGDVNALTNHGLVCVTGARRATPYGIALAQAAGKSVAELSLVLVTGAAMGCDLAAARAALEAGGVVIAVVGTGADVDYPSVARDVLRACRDGRGAVVSAEDWGAPPVRFAFPRRHRIMAALADVTVVCEAGRPSGVLSLAEAAHDLGRVVLAFPGSVFSPASAGANALIASGAARLLAGPSDLYACLAGWFAVPSCGHVDDARAADDEDPLVSALRPCPMRADDLSRALGTTFLDTLHELSQHELDGIVERLPDGRYSLTVRAYQELC